jgi:hypothetical protein
MIVLNLLPFWATWGAHGTDGLERVGFPLSFLERGGISEQQAFYRAWLVTDLVIVLIAAKVFADVTHGGFKATIHRLRTWGTPN